MSNDTVTVTRDGAIAFLTLNRPGALNALNTDMTLALSEATSALEADESVRCVVLSGAGEHFMAGGDIKQFHQGLEDPPLVRRQMFERMIGEVHASVIRLRRMPKPVVASVRGAVAGFGLSLMNACDLAVAADNAYFTLAYCHIGTTPDGSGTYGLPRLVGLKQAMEIALLGDRFDAARALSLGLVNGVVAAADLEAETLALARRLAKGPTLAYGRTKRLVNESLNRTLTEQLLA
ncbi:MAG: enoyl-CoA hydratase/isomerase family protein, partial [Rhodocyclaceae bacterium]|nr:enoyl-CoA hydratase/isomerase family protein [Rhodocyclaceae bacterium]